MHQDADISQCLDRLNKAAQQYAAVKSGSSGSSVEEFGNSIESKNALILATTSFLQSVQGPTEAIYWYYFELSRLGAVNALYDIGVFGKLPADGTSMSAAALAISVGVDKELIVRLMRAATLTGPFAETGVQQYSHTPFSLAYQDKYLAAGFKVASDEFALTMLRLSNYFQQRGWIEPTSQSKNPYTYAHECDDSSLWDFIQKNPVRLERFNLDMAASQNSSAWTINLYPFEKELSKLNSESDDVLVIDVGGGLGHAALKIRETLVHVKGRVILQDRAAVINDLAESLPGIELMGHDILSEQPVKGAAVYYLRRVLHDWTDADCVTILNNITVAMERGKSRILIAELVLPEKDVGVESIWYDMTVLTMSGKERTQSQWQNILDAAGLRIETVYRVPGTSWGVVEAYLK